MDAIQAIIDRAVADPDFLRRFLEDPVGTAEAEGFDASNISLEEMQAMRNLAKASWQGVVEVLEQRVSRMGITGSSLPGQH